MSSLATPVNSSLNESRKCVWNFFSFRCFAVFQNTTTLYYNEMCDNFFSSFFPRFVASPLTADIREYVLSIFLIFLSLSLSHIFSDIKQHKCFNFLYSLFEFLRFSFKIKHLYHHQSFIWAFVAFLCILKLK